MKTFKTRIICIGLLLCCIGCDRIPTGKHATVSYRQLLLNLTDPDYLARIDVPETAIVTSYDPTGGNDDFNHPLRFTPDGWAVLADIKGPGYVSRFWFTGSELLIPNERKPPVDEPQIAGFMPDIFNYERFCDYRGEIESIGAFLEQYSDSPFSDVFKLRKAACIERVSGIAQSRPMYEKIMAESKDAAAKKQAEMLLWFHERNSNAILGLYANTPARCFLDGQLVTETTHPAKLTVAGLELKPGRHVLAIQCRYHPYPAWIQACLRTHSGAVVTDSS